MNSTVAKLDEKELSAAETGYRDRISSNPKDDEAYVRLVEICWKSGRRTEAKELLFQARSIEPKAVRILLALAELAIDEGQLENSIDYINEVLEINPSDARALRAMGIVVRELSRYDEAIEYFSRWAELNPQVVDARIEIGHTYYVQGKNDQAREHFEIALELDPQSARVHNYLAILLHYNGELEESERLYKRAIELLPNCSDFYNNFGLLQRDLKNTDEEMEMYRKALDINPHNGNALTNLGSTLMRRGEVEEGLSIMAKAVEVAPNNAHYRFLYANALFRLERYTEAREGYFACLKLKPDHPIALNDLGVTYQVERNYEEAMKLHKKALEMKPFYPEALMNVAVIHQAQGDLERSLELLDQVIEIAPNYVEARYNKGNILRKVRRHAEAVESYRKAIEINPNFILSYHNMANALKELGRIDEAFEIVRQGLEIKDDYPDLYNTLGILSHFVGDMRQSIVAYQQAIAVDPKYVEAYNNLGLVLHKANKFAESIKCYEKAIELRPRFAEAYSNLGFLYNEDSLFDKAVEAFGKAIEIKPDLIEAHINQSFSFMQLGFLEESLSSHMRAMELKAKFMDISDRVLQLCRSMVELRRIPILYESESEIAVCRQHYRQNLLDMLDLLDKGPELNSDELDALRHLVFCTSNFYIAYQQCNDADLQALYARLVTKILEPELKPFLTPQPPKKRADRRIRLGVVSEFLRAHNGCYWSYDWLRNLPRDDYELFSYSVDGLTDHYTNNFATISQFKWYLFGEKSYLGALKAMRDDDLDVLIITDIGMGVATRVLSLARVAPVTCTAWGHPVTSGSDNVDFYLSSDLMEPENGDEHYTEKLVRLPNVGLNFPFPELPAEVPTRAQFDLPEDRPIYGTVQSLFKYLPQYDFIYPEIAKRVPDALFIFVAGKAPEVNNVFERRLRKAFESQGLSYEKYVQIIPRLSLPDFLQLLRVIDINLDSIGWTGGITTMRSLAVDCPVVTIPGEFMRGRHSSAMLEMIGVKELIANSLDEYIDIASKLGSVEYRKQMIERIQQTKAKLFDDVECVRYLDKFFKSEVAKVRGEQDIYPDESEPRTVSLDSTMSATVGSAKPVWGDSANVFGNSRENGSAAGTGDDSSRSGEGSTMLAGTAGGAAAEPVLRTPAAMMLVKCAEAPEAYPFFYRKGSCDEVVIDQIFQKHDYSLKRLAINDKIEKYRKEQEVKGMRPFILDIGANIGAAAVWFQQAYLVSKVVSVEPDDDNHKLLVRNAAGLNCLAIKGAGASKKGFVNVCDPGLGAFGLRTELVHDGSVETFTIPELLEKECTKGYFPFIAKIDIEGAEEELFSQNTDWIDLFPVLIVELHDWLLPGTNNARNFLQCVSSRARDFVYIGENVFSIRTPVGDD